MTIFSAVAVRRVGTQHVNAYHGGLAASREAAIASAIEAADGATVTHVAWKEEEAGSRRLLAHGEVEAR